MIREWHQRGWTPWIGAGLLFLIALSIWVWRNTLPVTIVYSAHLAARFQAR